MSDLPCFCHLKSCFNLLLNFVCWLHFYYMPNSTVFALSPANPAGAQTQCSPLLQSTSTTGGSMGGAKNEEALMTSPENESCFGDWLILFSEWFGFVECVSPVHLLYIPTPRAMWPWWVLVSSLKTTNREVESSTENPSSPLQSMIGHFVTCRTETTLKSQHPLMHNLHWYEVFMNFNIAL